MHTKQTYCTSQRAGIMPTPSGSLSSPVGEVVKLSSEEEAEPQRGRATCWGLHSWIEAMPGLDPGVF